MDGQAIMDVKSEEYTLVMVFEDNMRSLRNWNTIYDTAIHEYISPAIVIWLYFFQANAYEPRRTNKRNYEYLPIVLQNFQNKI